MDREAGEDAKRAILAQNRLSRNFLIVAVALFLVKLLLVSHREIVPEPHDAEAYVSASVDELGSLFTGAADHPPGASLIMALARSLGIPFRVFMELFLGVAAFLFFRPLVASIRIGTIAVALSYALLLFHPALILEMDRAMSDSVSFLCWLMGAGGIIGFVVAPREAPQWSSLALTVASFAFAGITRSGEGAIVLVEMLAVCLLSIPLFRGESRWRRGRAIVACFCAVVANFTATQALSATHYLNSGYWGGSAVESREWWQLYGTLLSLPVPRNDRRFLINRPTLDMAESFSEDLHSMNACLEDFAPQYSSEGLGNEYVSWAITECLPGKNSSKEYARMRTINADILNGARERHVELAAPVLGLIPQPPVQWLSSLPSSVVRVGIDAVRIPSSTRVAQNSWRAELFDRGLLRRTALVAASENPELPGYQSSIKIIYTVLATLFWPSIPIIFLVTAVITMISARMTTKGQFIAFALSVMMIDVLCRLSFYTFVSWIMWDFDPRYILGPRVLTVVIVSALLTVCLPLAVGAALQPWLVKLSALWAPARNQGYPTRRP